ncbi:MAG TPA: hypothetical protein VII94_01530 [Candidatus Saccharimonadales bacterium]
MPVDLGPTSLLGAIAPTIWKAKFLVTLDDGVVGKTRSFQRFISLEQPRPQDGIIQVKGIFCDKSEEEIIKTYGDILLNTPKEQTLEMQFPLHRVYSVRSLVFNAVKSITNLASDK